MITILESQNKNANDFNETIEIKETDFMKVLDNFVPTLNQASLAYYEKYFINNSDSKWLLKFSNNHLNKILIKIKGYFFYILLFQILADLLILLKGIHYYR